MPASHVEIPARLLGAAFLVRQRLSRKQCYAREVGLPFISESRQDPSSTLKIASYTMDGVREGTPSSWAEFSDAVRAKLRIAKDISIRTKSTSTRHSADHCL